MVTRIFVSYADEDAAFCDSFITHLAILCSNGTATCWHSGLLVAGEDTLAASKHQLKSANIIVFLLSADFLASSRCQDEIDQALRRREQESTAVMPVLVRACDWRGSRVSQLPILPSSEEPIATLSHKDDGWAEVTNAIRTLVASKSKPTAIPRSTPLWWTVRPSVAIIGVLFCLLIAFAVWMRDRLMRPYSIIDEPADRGSDNSLQIDDVIVQRDATPSIRIDVRLRNVGSDIVNVTRADVHLLKAIGNECHSASAYQPSATYVLDIHGAHNEVAVAHVLKSGEVDAFHISARIHGYECQAVIGEIVVRYNGNVYAVSKPITLKGKENSEIIAE